MLARTTATTLPPRLGDSLLEAAEDFYHQGWVSIPLAPDATGRPKRPITPRWTETPQTWDAIEGRPWQDARGIGIVLGPRSGNLAAIDVDDSGLADAVAAVLIRGHVSTRLVRTVSDNLHVVFREQKPSPSTRTAVRWEGRDITIEFKGTGTQIASPPTPGYTLMLDGPPLEVPTIAAAWTSIAAKLGLEQPVGTIGSGGYPRPWQRRVVEGDRNQAMFVEAHRLREARVPLEEALELLRLRFERSYDQEDATWREMEQTVRSAYRKGFPSVRQLVEWQLS